VGTEAGVAQEELGVEEEDVAVVSPINILSEADTNYLQVGAVVVSLN
jgi:hypothetical protein